MLWLLVMEYVPVQEYEHLVILHLWMGTWHKPTASSMSCKETKADEYIKLIFKIQCQLKRESKKKNLEYLHETHTNNGDNTSK